MRNKFTAENYYYQLSKAQSLSEAFELQQDYLKMCGNYLEYYITIYLDTVESSFKRMMCYFEQK